MKRTCLASFLPSASVSGTGPRLRLAHGPACLQAVPSKLPFFASAGGRFLIYKTRPQSASIEIGGLYNHNGPDAQLLTGGQPTVTVNTSTKHPHANSENSQIQANRQPDPNIPSSVPQPGKRAVLLAKTSNTRRTSRPQHPSGRPLYPPHYLVTPTRKTAILLAKTKRAHLRQSLNAMKRSDSQAAP